jgi:hypothetical protein
MVASGPLAYAAPLSSRTLPPARLSTTLARVTRRDVARLGEAHPVLGEVHPRHPVPRADPAVAALRAAVSVTGPPCPIPVRRPGQPARYYLVDLGKGHVDAHGAAGRKPVRQRRVLGYPAHQYSPTATARHVTGPLVPTAQFRRRWPYRSACPARAYRRAGRSSIPSRSSSPAGEYSTSTSALPATHRSACTARQQRRRGDRPPQPDHPRLGGLLPGGGVQRDLQLSPDLPLIMFLPPLRMGTLCEVDERSCSSLWHSTTPLRFQGERRSRASRTDPALDGVGADDGRLWC